MPSPDADIPAPIRLLADTAATDPACELSPHHRRMLALAEKDAAGRGYSYRGRAASADAVAMPSC
jgi:hypothetical protein